EDGGVGPRARVRTADNEPGEVGNDDHQRATDAIGDLAEAAEVDYARIGRTAGDDHLRPVLRREPLDLVEIDAVVVTAHAIGHHVEPLAGEIYRRAVGQVPAGREVEPHEGVARPHQRHEG